MDFSLEWHQQQLQEVARDFLAEHCAHARLRELEAGELGYSRETYRAMAELDWHELAVGDADEDLIDLVVLYEQFGRAALPGPHFGSTVLAGPLLAGSAQPGHGALRARLASGDAVLAVALYEESAGYDPESVTLRVAEDGDGFVLDGRKMFVPYALGAEALLVLARTGEAPDALSFLLVPADADGLELTALRAMSNDRLFQVDLTGVRVGADALVGERDGGWAALQAQLPRATVLQAAELVGLADAAFDQAVAYTKVRIAFGRPIGAFQAIQHKCADMLSDRDAARFLVYQAAVLVNLGRGHEAEVAMAKAFAVDASRRVCKEAHQIYGGHGFVLENPLNYFYRRQKVLELMLGDHGEQLDRVADMLGV
jgi:alkylation response protein AidB-like acyl-CoA dehydrogenase